MAGRIGYYGGIVINGLILDLDAAKLDSYPRTGTSWRDVSGNQNNGILINGPRFDSGNGGSIVFDGTNDYVNCGNSINLRISVGSISTWFKRTGDGTRVGEIFIHNQSGISPFGGFEMYIDRTTKKIGMTIRNSNNNAQSIISNSSITTGLWVNIVGVFDGSTVSIYLNGTQDVNVISTISSLGSTTQVLGIGAAISDSTYNFKGNIAQTSIYNRALSSQEILQNYNAIKIRYGL